jgi:GntR family transcriptional regulator/MocR family aminotransferase
MIRRGELQLSIMLDRASGEPLGQQVYAQVRKLIVEGLLEPNARLPPTRTIADELGCSRATVVTAFERLWSEGYLTSRIGAGTFVSPSAAVGPSRSRSRREDLNEADEGRLSARGMGLANARQPGAGADVRLLPAQPDVDTFPHDLWLTLGRKVWRRPSAQLAQCCDPAGFRPLREAICTYLASFRRIACQPDDIVVTSGATQAIDLIARIMTDPGDSVWIEDPSRPNLRLQLSAAGARSIVVPVDREGMDVAAGMQVACRSRIAFVSAAHHFPLGFVMSDLRRAQLLRWANDHDAWVVENDCEYRDASGAPPPLATLDPGRVFYVGSFSKVLLPSLRLGFLVLPTRIPRAFVRARTGIDRHPPLYCQPILARFINEGHLTRHIRQTRALYESRRSALLESLRRHMGDYLALDEPCTGLQIVGRLRSEIAALTSDTEVQSLAQARGLSVRTLSGYYLEANIQQGLVVGYGRLPVEDSDSIVRKLRTIVDDCVTRRPPAHARPRISGRAGETIVLERGMRREWSGPVSEIGSGVGG